MQRLFLLFLGIVLLIISGCGEGTPIDTGTPSPPTESSKVPEASTAEEPKEELKKADVGATGKGQFADSAEKPMSIITVPLATYFRAQEMSVFRIQIPQALKLYQAETGEMPKTHDEFMQNIIKKNQIQLPKLPEGDTYVYNPSTAELMIRTRK